MEELGKSLHDQFANHSLLWFGSDNEQAYQDNLLKRKGDLEKFGWLDRNITYNFNKQGFRSENFDGSPSVVFLGASDTLGTGLPLEDTWTYKVAQNLGLTRYNLGLGGASGNTTFRIASYWLDKLNPKVVVLMSPLNPRFELIEEGEERLYFYQLSPRMWTKGDSYWRYFDDPGVKSRLFSFYKPWIGSDYNLTLQQKRNELAIAKLSDQNNAKFILADSETDWADSKDYARDLTHFGVRSNQIVADLVLSRI